MSTRKAPNKRPERVANRISIPMSLNTLSNRLPGLSRAVGTYSSRVTSACQRIWD